MLLDFIYDIMVFFPELLKFLANRSVVNELPDIVSQ